MSWSEGSNMHAHSQSGTALAVTSGWLDSGTTDGAAGQSVTTTIHDCGTWYYPNGWPYTWYPWVYPVVTSPSRPIKLTLSEIERLRRAARTYKALKAILAKFTSHIEITVDFE